MAEITARSQVADVYSVDFKWAEGAIAYVVIVPAAVALTLLSPYFWALVVLLVIFLHKVALPQAARSREADARRAFSQVYYYWGREVHHTRTIKEMLKYLDGHGYRHLDAGPNHYVLERIMSRMDHSPVGEAAQLYLDRVKSVSLCYLADTMFKNQSHAQSYTAFLEKILSREVHLEHADHVDSTTGIRMGDIIRLPHNYLGHENQGVAGFAAALMKVGRFRV